MTIPLKINNIFLITAHRACNLEFPLDKTLSYSSCNIGIRGMAVVDAI